MVVVMTCASVTATHAGDAAPATRSSGSIYSAVVQYGVPSRTSAGVMVFIPTAVQGGFRSSGFIADGLVGESGGRLSIGRVTAVEYLGLDLRAVLTRTWASPRGASADATYAGAEVGASIAYVRVSAGVIRRVAGTPGPRATAGAWSIGLQLPLKRS